MKALLVAAVLSTLKYSIDIASFPFKIANSKFSKKGQSKPPPKYFNTSNAVRHRPSLAPAPTPNPISHPAPGLSLPTKNLDLSHGSQKPNGVESNEKAWVKSPGSNVVKSQPLLRNLPPKEFSPQIRRLQRRLFRLASAQKGDMRVGCHVIHLPSGKEVGIKSHKMFPLASVAKVPIMIEAALQLQRSHEKGGALHLNKEIILKEEHKCIGSGCLWKTPVGSKVTFGECLELMQTISDNTAADIVLKELNVHHVRNTMKKMGFMNTEIYLSQRQAFLLALKQHPNFKKLSSEELVKKWKRLSIPSRIQIAKDTERRNKSLHISEFCALEGRSEIEQKKSRSLGYRSDMEVAEAVDNLGSPADMSRLLAKLAKAEILSPNWTEHCMDILLNQKYGTRRLPKCLPEGTKVYHKTGTILGVVNASGIINIGNTGNHVAVSAFVNRVGLKKEVQAEAVIARMSKIVYDTFHSLPKWARKTCKTWIHLPSLDPSPPRLPERFPTSLTACPSSS